MLFFKTEVSRQPLFNPTKKVIARYTGEDNIIIGSDYGHRDPSEERQLVQTMRAREDIPGQLTEKILCENARRFYPL